MTLPCSRSTHSLDAPVHVDTLSSSPPAFPPSLTALPPALPLSSSLAAAPRGTLGLTILPCPSPLVYNLGEGVYNFNFQSTSNAGLSSQVSQTIVVDASPPVTQMTTQPQTAPYPSLVSDHYIS